MPELFLVTLTSSPGPHQRNIQKVECLEPQTPTGGQQDSVMMWFMEPHFLKSDILTMKVTVEKKKNTTGFTPIPLLFIVLDGIKVISELSHQGQGLEPLTVFHPRVDLQLTL